MISATVDATVARPPGRQRPSRTVTPRPPSRRRSSRSSRDLPIPGSPTMPTTWPRPASARAARSSSMSISRSRPTNGIRPAPSGSPDTRRPRTRWATPGPPASPPGRTRRSNLKWRPRSGVTAPLLKDVLAIQASRGPKMLLSRARGAGAFLARLRYAFSCAYDGERASPWRGGALCYNHGDGSRLLGSLFR